MHDIYSFCVCEIVLYDNMTVLYIYMFSLYQSTLLYFHTHFEKVAKINKNKPTECIFFL